MTFLVLLRLWIGDNKEIWPSRSLSVFKGSLAREPAERLKESKLVIYVTRHMSSR